MDAQYYRINLDNYACSGFASHSKAYYGTLPQFQAFMEALECGEKSKENYGYLTDAFRAFLAGNQAILHHVLYHEEPLLTPVELIEVKRISFENFSWEHLNIWQQPYRMKCNRAETTHVWLKDGERYVRCLSAKFEGLKFNGRPLDGWFWGFPCMIVETGETTFNRLAVVERVFSTEQECRLDHACFSQEDVNFTEICNDIFADG